MQVGWWTWCGARRHLSPAHFLEELDANGIDHGPQSLLWEQVVGIMAVAGGCLLSCLGLCCCALG